jgi:hypothetical protein
VERNSKIQTKRAGSGPTTGGMGGFADLPAGLHGKARDPHPEWSASRTRSRTLLVGKVLGAAGTTCELDDQAFAHEVGAICIMPTVRSFVRS